MRREIQLLIISVSASVLAFVLQQYWLCLLAAVPALLTTAHYRFAAIALLILSLGLQLPQLNWFALAASVCALGLGYWCSTLIVRQPKPVSPIQGIERLAAGIAHQFNNMLTPVLGYAELSQDALAPQSKVHAYQKQIHLAATRAKNLVEQMLNFSEPAVAHKEWVWLHEVVDEAVQLARAIAPNSIKIGSKISHENIQVQVDAKQFHTLLMALLSNAIEAIGPRRGLIELRADLRSKSVCLQICDNGCGMSAQVRQRMFEPLFTTKGETWRTGMGLAVVQGILTSHDLQCEVHSDHRSGTQISLNIPAHLGMLDVLAVRAKNTAYQPPSRRCYGEVLVLAEDVALSQLICAQLDSIGFKVHHFHHSMSALKWHKQKKRTLDLVVIDIGLPYCSALDVLGELRGQRDDLPSLLLVGGGEDQELLDQLHLLPVNVIRKPYVAAQFYAEVLALMGKRKAGLQILRHSA